MGCFSETPQIDINVPYFIRGDFDNKIYYLADSSTSFGTYIPAQNMLVLNATTNKIEILIQIFNFNIETQVFPVILPGDSSLTSSAQIKFTIIEGAQGGGNIDWRGSTINEEEFSIILENITSNLEIIGSFNGILKDPDGNIIQAENGAFDLLLNEKLL